MILYIQYIPLRTVLYDTVNITEYVVETSTVYTVQYIQYVQYTRYAVIPKEIILHIPTSYTVEYIPVYTVLYVPWVSY